MRQADRPENPLYEVGFRVGIGLTIIAILVRQTKLQPGVFCREGGVCAQGIPKPEPRAPESAAIRDYVEMVRSMCVPGFTEPMHHVRSVGPVEIACFGRGRSATGPGAWRAPFPQTRTWRAMRRRRGLRRSGLIFDRKRDSFALRGSIIVRFAHPRNSCTAQLVRQGATADRLHLRVRYRFRQRMVRGTAQVIAKLHGERLL